MSERRPLRDAAHNDHATQAEVTPSVQSDAVSEPYAHAARDYYESGLGGPITLPPRRKKPPLDGWTGEDGAYPSRADVETWCEERPRSNIGIRLRRGSIGLDLDLYKPGAAEVFRELEQRLGPLPSGPVSTSRDDGSGIRWFRVPDNYQAAGTISTPAGDCGETIQWFHRYAVVWPSIHEDTGAVYRWADGHIPAFEDLPWLPLPWQNELNARPPVSSNGQQLFQQPGSHPHRPGWTDPDVDQLAVNGMKTGTQHDQMRDLVASLVGKGMSREAIQAVWWTAVSNTTLHEPGRWTQHYFDETYDKAYAKYSQPEADAETELPETLSLRLLRGGCILDVPSVPDAVWGDGTDVLWAFGQAMIIAGPDGVGKTTVAGNLIQARLGLGTGEVLGMPVKPGDRNVLVLLMDRPQQAMAALARLFKTAHRDILDARLRIWRGPPPQDLARNTAMLTQLCALADADTCIIDSLKDAALKLSDDETGSGWNRARQLAIEAGTELVELHHPRKAQDGNRKPSKLEDLYGSRWITAGAGSVISLWGQAGDPVVELTHLKPVAETVGPWQVGIDGATGRVSVSHGIDLLEQIRYRGSEGITALVAARLITGTDKPSKADVEKARRRLDRKVAEGLLIKAEGQAGGVHGGVHAAWFLKAVTEPFTPDHEKQESAGQSDHATDHGPFTPLQEPERSRAAPHIKWGARDRGPADSCLDPGCGKPPRHGCSTCWDHALMEAVR